MQSTLLRTDVCVNVIFVALPLPLLSPSEEHPQQRQPDHGVEEVQKNLRTQNSLTRPAALSSELHLRTRPSITIVQECSIRADLCALILSWNTSERQATASSLVSTLSTLLGQHITDKSFLKKNCSCVTTPLDSV
jgi:hypothetical protein